MTSSKKKTANETSNPNQEVATMKKTAKKQPGITKKSTTAASSDAPAAAGNGVPAAATTSPSTAPPTGTSLSGIPAQLQALEQTCGYGDPLPDATRTTSEDLVRRVPSTIVDRIIALAARGGGVVAGIAFDPDAAKSALAQADEADAIATAGQMLVRRAQDQSIRLRAGVTSDASAIRIAMRGYAKTAQGASLQPENDEIRTLAKQHLAARKARKTREVKAVKAATSSATTGAEAPPPTPTPAATAAPKAS
jgi:hypothetical protein